jgi:hypothetical protein
MIGLTRDWMRDWMRYWMTDVADAAMAPLLEDRV